jgi:hypothetical protein
MRISNKEYRPEIIAMKQISNAEVKGSNANIGVDTRVCS